MDTKEAELLIEKYNRGQASEAEVLLIQYWLIHLATAGSAEIDETDYIEMSESMRMEILALTKPKEAKLWKKISIAASIIFTIGIFYGISDYYTNSDKHTDIAIATDSQLSPGKIGATLTLADGRKINLSAANKGKLAQEAGISISKNEEGQLIYVIENRADQSYKVNTLSTARGETYMITLPDKSKVWLNAASSLTYSGSLYENGKRAVTLSGEAYFEIAKDKSHPFIVKTNKQQIEVLGTHFNVNAYAGDQGEKTVLLEGSVKIGTPGSSAVLKPGQQGKVEDLKVSVSNVDTDLAVAWKNNEFNFEDQQIEEVMKVIERWYNAEVIYVGSRPRQKFNGSISRFNKINDVLAVISATDAVHFKVEGRRIYVSK
ncbi:FecR domain-containing protein [Sphingobacterium sp.]|uniref:FecR family protein n=1 Tax=Sphingobacterium sp. TaxID=341027 RepID=UPI0031D87DCB